MLTPTSGTGSVTFVNRFHADRFMSIALLLDRMSVVPPEQGTATATDDTKNFLRPMLLDVRADFETVGLRLSTKQIDRIESLLGLTGTTNGQIANALAELHNRIGDEIQDSRFVQIPPSKTAFLDGLNVADSLGVALADATTDLEEAGK